VVRTLNPRPPLAPLRSASIRSDWVGLRELGLGVSSFVR
jgi:hypothetical protein